MQGNLSPSSIYGWPVSVGFKLLLLCLVLLVIDQLQSFTKPSGNFFVSLSSVKADSDCEYDIVKPPRFGKRNAIMDQCNENKRREINSNRQRIVMNLISTLQKDSHIEPRWHGYLNKLTMSELNNDKLARLVHDFMAQHRQVRGAKRRLDLTTDSLAVSGKQPISIAKDVPQSADRPDPDSISMDLTRDGLFGHFSSSLEDSQESSNDFVQHLDNSKPK